MKPLKYIILLLFAAQAYSAEVIPPVPARYFNDYANVVSAPTADRLNKQLEDFERQTSNQVVVAIYPKMESDSSIEDYTVRVAQKWGAGQKGKKNGVVLFVFIQNRTMYLQVGYGLEGVIPDITAKQIIDEEIKPRFRDRDFDGGLTAAVNSIIAATKGEYKGIGRTVNESHKVPQVGFLLILGIIVFIIIFSNARKEILYGSSGYRRRSSWSSGWSFGGGSDWGGSSSSSGSGGGGFSSGGGSFGGGGAGGSW